MKRKFTSEQEKLITDNFQTFSDFMDKFRKGDANDEEYSKLQWEFVKTVVRFDPKISDNIRKYIQDSLYRAVSRMDYIERNERRLDSFSTKGRFRAGGSWLREYESFLTEFPKLDYDDLVRNIKDEQSRAILGFLCDGMNLNEIAKVLKIKRFKVRYIINTKIQPLLKKSFGIEDGE